MSGNDAGDEVVAASEVSASPEPSSPKATFSPPATRGAAAEGKGKDGQQPKGSLAPPAPTLLLALPPQPLLGDT
eukprot:gene4642-4842_t